MLTNGKCEFNVTDLVGGNHTIFVCYNGDNNYLSINNTANLILTHISAQGINVVVNSHVEYGDVAAVNVTVIGVDGKVVPTGNVTFFIGVSEVGNVTLTDGKCSFPVPVLSHGDYTISAYYNGDNNYVAIGDSTVLSVVPKTIDLGAVINNGTFGDKYFSGHINTGMSGRILFNLSDTFKRVEVTESGEFTVPLKLIAGNYSNVRVNFLSADGNYRGDSYVNFTIFKDNTTVSIDTSDIVNNDNNNTVAKIDSKVTVNPVKGKAGEKVNVTIDPVKGKAGEKVNVTIRVTDKNGNSVNDGNLTVGFNGKEYYKYVVGGIATVEVVLPRAGNYSVTAYYEGINYNSSYAVSSVEVSEVHSSNPNFNHTPKPTSINNNGSNMMNTGNPLFVLLFALCAIGLESLRRKF